MRLGSDAKQMFARSLLFACAGSFFVLSGWQDYWCDPGLVGIKTKNDQQTAVILLPISRF
jgi:hypothetical protein